MASDYSIPVHNTQPAPSVSPMTTAVVMTVVVFTAGAPPVVAAAGKDDGRSEKQQDKKRFFHDSLLRLRVDNLKQGKGDAKLKTCS